MADSWDGLIFPLDNAMRFAYIEVMASTMTRAERKAEREAHIAKMAAIHAENLGIVKTGRCPQCGAGLHRNNSLTGWWQCNRSGSGHFRIDQTGEHCSFQCFTE